MINEKLHYKIFLETKDRYYQKIILYKDAKILDFCEGKLDLVSSLESLLVKNQLSLEMIGAIESSSGPGSFTALRAGATVANILNWATLKKQLAELTYPEYGAEPTITPHKKKY